MKNCTERFNWQKPYCRKWYRESCASSAISEWRQTPTGIEPTVVDDDDDDDDDICKHIFPFVFHHCDIIQLGCLDSVRHYTVRHYHYHCHYSIVLLSVQCYRDPIMFEVPYLRNSGRWTRGHRTDYVAGNQACGRYIVSDVTTEGGRVIVYMWIFTELETYFSKYLENGASELKNSKQNASPY